MKSKRTVDMPGFTPKDVVELLEKAKAMGVLELRLKDLEFRFDDDVPSWDDVPSIEERGHDDDGKGEGQPLPYRYNPNRGALPPERGFRPVCKDCGVQKIPSTRGPGFYCVECFIRRKENRR